MKSLISFVFLILLLGCSNKNQSDLVLEIDGVFSSSEIELTGESDSLNDDRYFSITVLNNNSVPIKLATTGNEQFYSPTVIEYSFFNERDNRREKHKGINDFFSTDEMIMAPHTERKFYFYFPLEMSTDTVIFLFDYIKEDRRYFVETSYLLKEGKVKSLIFHKSISEF